MIFKIKYFIILWTIISLGFWLIYSFNVEYIALALYMPLWLVIVGIPLYIKRNKVENILKKWDLNSLAKFVILGYSMVLLEEIIAGIVNHLSEEFSLYVMITRILQFQFFNLFTFTGFIFGVYLSLKLFNYSRTEIFFVSGLWGLYTEKVILQLFNNPLYVVFTAIPMILIYGLIIYPSLLSIDIVQNKKIINPFIKYILTILLIFLLSIIPVLIMSILRTNYPFLFPPIHLIPL